MSLLPWRWHIVSILLNAGRGLSAETCGLDDVFPPEDLGSCPEPLYMCIYRFAYAISICFCLYSYSEWDLPWVGLHPITVYRTGILGVRCSCV